MSATSAIVAALSARDGCSAGREIVIHMAAQALVRPSYAEPVETFATNVMGTVNLLEAVRRGPSVQAVVIVTSDKCYRDDGSMRPIARTIRSAATIPTAAARVCRAGR